MKRRHTKQNKKLRRNKKAIAPFILDFYSYIAFIIIVIIFYFLISMKAQQQVVTIENFQGRTTADQVMLTFLRTPVEVNGQKMTVADIVSLIDVEEGKEERLKTFEQTAEEVFTPIFGDKFYVKINEDLPGYCVENLVASTALIEVPKAGGSTNAKVAFCALKPGTYDMTPKQNN